MAQAFESSSAAAGTSDDHSCYGDAVVSLGRALEQWIGYAYQGWTTPNQYAEKLSDGTLILKCLDRLISSGEANTPSRRRHQRSGMNPQEKISSVHDRLVALGQKHKHVPTKQFLNHDMKAIFALLEYIYEEARKLHPEEIMEVQPFAMQTRNNQSAEGTNSSTPKAGFMGFLQTICSPTNTQDLRKICKKLSTERDEKDSKLKEMKAEKEELVREKKRINSQIEQLKLEVSESEGSRAKLQANLNELQEQVESLKGFITQKDKDIENLRSEQRVAMQRKNEELDRLREQVEQYEMEQQNEALLKSKQDAEARIKELEEQLTIAEESHKDAQSRSEREMSQMEQFCNKLKVSAADTKAKARSTISKCRAAHELLKHSRHAMREISGEMRENFQTAAQEFSTFSFSLMNCVEKINEESKASNERFLRESRERRRAFNQLQDLRGNIRVFCRVRPLLEHEKQQQEKSVIECTSDYDMELLPDNASYTDTHNGGGDRASSASRNFEFDRVFSPVSTQKEVYDEISPMVMSALDGYHSCIFAYGQTGSGKTYTMEGGKAPDETGVYYRTLNQLFEEQVARRDSHQYSLKVSMVEIYNENVRDLLSDPNESKQKYLEIRKGPNGNYLPEARTVSVNSVEDVEKTMSRGAENRAVGATDANEHSSRSHSLLLVDIYGKSIVDGSKTYGRLVLVDLAGSERVSKSKASGQRMTEAQNINRSLSALGDVIGALTHKKTHVPFRNSKLTYLLQDSLGKDNKALMVVQVSPVESSRSESQCSLNFASRVRKVEQGQAKRHEENAEHAKLKSSLSKLKEDLRKVTEERDSLKESVNQLKNETNTYKKELKNTAQKLDVESSVEEAKEKKIESMKAKLQEEKQEREQLSKQVQTLERKLKQQTAKPVETGKTTRNDPVVKAAVQKAIDSTTKQMQGEKEQEIKKAVDAVKQQEMAKQEQEKRELEKQKAKLKAELNRLKSGSGATTRQPNKKRAVENNSSLKDSSEFEIKKSRTSTTPTNKQTPPNLDSSNQEFHAQSNSEKIEAPESHNMEEEEDEDVSLEVGAFANRLSELNDTFDIKHPQKQDAAEELSEEQSGSPEKNILAEFDNDVSPIKKEVEEDEDVTEDDKGSENDGEVTFKDPKSVAFRHPNESSFQEDRGATGSPSVNISGKASTPQTPKLNSAMKCSSKKAPAFNNRLEHLKNEGQIQGEPNRGVKFLTPGSQKNKNINTPQPKPCPSYKVRHEQGMSPAVKSILKREEEYNDENDQPDNSFDDADEFASSSQSNNDAGNSSMVGTRGESTQKFQNSSANWKKPRESKTALFGSLLRESSRNLNVALPKTATKKPRTSNQASRAKAKAKTAAGVGAIIRGMSAPATRASQAKSRAKNASSQRVQWR